MSCVNPCPSASAFTLQAIESEVIWSSVIKRCSAWGLSAEVYKVCSGEGKQNQTITEQLLYGTPLKRQWCRAELSYQAPHWCRCWKVIFTPEYLVSRISCATDSIDNVSNGSLFRTLELIADTVCPYWPLSVVLPDDNALFDVGTFRRMSLVFSEGVLCFLRVHGNGSAKRAMFFGCKYNAPIFLNQHQEAFYLTSGLRRGNSWGKKKKKPNLWKIRNRILNGKHNIGYVMSLILFKAIIWLRERLYKTVI